MGQIQKEFALRKRTILEAVMSPEVSIIVPLLIICIYTGINNPMFFSLKNIQIIIRYCAFLGALALGQAFVLMTGEIDLSVGTNSVFTSIIFTTFAITFGWNPIVSIAGGIAAGALIGFINSIFAFWIGISSWIVTLAMQYVCIGFATVISRGAVIHSLTGAYETFTSARPLGLTWMLWITVGLFVIMEIVIRLTPVGRIIKSVGLSPEASRIAGVRVKWVKTGCMIVSGAMAGVCGVLQSLSTLSGSPSTGIGNEFPAIICCAIGGVSISGGKGSMLGVFIGVLMYQTLKNCLQSLNLNNNYQLVLTGIILVLAVCFDIMKTNMRARVTK